MCVWGKIDLRSSLPFLFRDEEEEEEEGRVPRERDCWEKRFPPVSFFFRSFVLSLSLSKKKERFKKSKKSRSRIFGERGLTKQRDLIREERLVLPKARSISVSFSVLSIIIANDLLTLFHIKRRLATTTNE